jgi:myosin heavy subunit
MEELAEPLIPQDLGLSEEEVKAMEAKKAKLKKKDNEEPCEETDLHFIRCLKPNDDKVANVFHHAMTLQQITYMGVLESIRVKQENFPYRYKYEDFYRNYELLSPEYTKGRYDLMTESDRRSKEDKWPQYAEEILKVAFAPMQAEEWAHLKANGVTRLLMHAECKMVLDKCKSKAS